MEQSEGKREFRDKWGWYRVMYRLANGDLLQLDAVSRILITEAFTFLAYEIDLQLTESIKINGNA